LKGIAERYNMGITHLKELNGFNDKKTLKADVGLRVIVREYHKLLDGENLVQIGQRYGVSKYEILRATGIDFADEMDEIYPGVELIIPIKK
ncbi:MAG: LysM peptidoglycan-binding domain-containing protein, partial [Thermonemataceae bacterium]|nr:LysM peptidoglycan-binding domain-containing protein [Thermonemataceae bacterium]